VDANSFSFGEENKDSSSKSSIKSSKESNFEAIKNSNSNSGQILKFNDYNPFKREVKKKSQKPPQYRFASSG
jgi:hypothetical protein